MPEVDQAYTESAYGWPVLAAAVLRWLARALSVNPGIKDVHASALEFLDGGLNNPAGPH